MHNFKELKVWQKAVDFAVKIYSVTKLFPNEEKFGLVSQMRRAGISIPSNIAEGCAKTSRKSLVNSLEISLGESFELETQMIISERVGILNLETAREMEVDLAEVQRMIMGLKTSIEAKS
ncbi:four helix bundle protein [Algoriphagus aestuariicola]|jgi:four helix bundle protein|uniref:Four helix bundle protein n=1 Tax=Algoriphagus aestuariicola TaxID=1852016 RepID=A0ABS3BU62_9BACT|nr:four helix bundle protein [Algoriphagus aestuariicola]MBN7802369.1 four helix bundle protein [Algoriphagus aestuariicola]